MNDKPRFRFRRPEKHLLRNHLHLSFRNLPAFSFSVERKADGRRADRAGQRKRLRTYEARLLPDVHLVGNFLFCFEEEYALDREKWLISAVLLHDIHVFILCFYYTYTGAFGPITNPGHPSLPWSDFGMIAAEGFISIQNEAIIFTSRWSPSSHCSSASSLRSAPGLLFQEPSD